MVFICILLQWNHTLTFLLLLAIKTRKIERKDFKDTKKVNAYILSLFILICLFFSLWQVLRTVNQPIASKLIVGAAYGMAALFCQLFLFAPKTIPPFRRHVRNICCNCIPYIESLCYADAWLSTIYNSFCCCSVLCAVVYKLYFTCCNNLFFFYKISCFEKNHSCV